MSVVKCTIIVRPLTHFTIFTDRALRAIICTFWILSLVVSGAINIGVTEAYFDWTTMIAYMKRHNSFYTQAFAAANYVVATLIIMTAYIKVFRVVRRQVRSMQSVGVEPLGSTDVTFGSSVRSAKNLLRSVVRLLPTSARK